MWLMTQSSQNSAGINAKVANICVMAYQSVNLGYKLAIGKTLTPWLFPSTSEATVTPECTWPSSVRGDQPEKQTNKTKQQNSKLKEKGKICKDIIYFSMNWCSNIIHKSTKKMYDY